MEKAEIVEEEQEAAGSAADIRAFHAAPVKSRGELHRAEIELAIAADMHGVVLDILGIEIAGQFISGDHQGAAAPGDRDCVAHMVAVAVGKEDSIAGDLFRFHLGLRVAGNKGVDQHLMASGVDHKSRMSEISEPGHRAFSLVYGGIFAREQVHLSPLTFSGTQYKEALPVIQG